MYADEVEKERGSRSGHKKNFGRQQGTGIDGKWKRDMFQTANRSPKQSYVTKKRQQVQVFSKSASGAVSRNITTASIRGKNQERPAFVRKVQTGPSTLFISNLASSVTQEDLEELFEQYEPEVVQLHFDASGTSLGTADLIVPQPQVAVIKKNLEGVLLDEQQIEIMETTVANQVSVFDRIKKVERTNDFKPAKNIRVVMKAPGRRGDF